MRELSESGPTTASPECLTDALLIQVADGHLGQEEMARAWAHAAGCATCRCALDAVFPETESLQEGEEPTLPTAEEPPQGAAPAWRPPEYFGPFRLGPEIGRGAMGVVYRARNLSVRRDVALKFIASAGTSSRVEAFFDNEARLLASFNHPNIMTLYSVGQVDGHTYIETELIEGQRLADLPRPLPADQVLELGLGLARGLEAAHAKHILHRDIKPSNVIKTNDGWVKLLDFGLAEQVDPDAPEGARDVAGTLVYMAPECAEGAPATERSDIYSLGAVLYQLCVDRVPLEDARLGPGVQRNLAKVIERCIRADPSERYASAKLLVQALEVIPRVARPDTNPYRGLATFEAEHQALFFGRDADIRRILERLNRQPMVLVAAESGVGKSSLCRAGIVARADAGQVVAGRTLTPVTLAPGRKPLDSLAVALAPILSVAEHELFTQLADEPGRAGRQVRDAFQARGGVLLFVDQMEELVTLSDVTERDAFALALAELARPSESVRVLLAVRGDFFTRVAELPGLADLAERALYLLQPMSASGVYEAIVAPARACGVSFESDGLVEELVDAAAHGRGGLPLLSFALAELWERRDRERAQITAAALRALGGIDGMLARHADGVVGPLSDAQLREARRLLLRLITEDRTRIERSALELGAESPDAQAALRALVQGRLLQVRADGGQVLYQITHDSLIHSWPKLVTWIEEDQGQAVVRRRLEAAAAEWERLKRSDEALWPKRPLDEASGLDPSTLNSGEREFLRVSRRRVTRRRWLRRLAAVLSAGVVAAAYGGFRVQKRRETVDFVKARQALARSQMEEAGRARGEACAGREDALRWFDPPGPGGSPLPEGETSRWEVGEKRWAVALAKHGQALAAYEGVQRTLESALDREYDRDGSRQLLFEGTYGKLELEECFHPQGARSPVVSDLLNRFDDPKWRRRVDVPAELELTTDPAGAAVEITRYTESGGRLGQESVPAPADHSRLQLQPSSYLLHLSAPGRTAVALPVLLGRGQRERVHVALPAHVPDGMVYVPPGCFLEGSDDEALRSEVMEASPLHRACMERGYLIGRMEITFGDWIQYLDTLPTGAEARHVLERPPPPAGGFTLRWQPLSGWALVFYRSGHRIFSAWEGEDFRYKARTRNASGDWRALPLLGVSALDLEGYFAWLDRSGRLPGARLCREDEWERAARGADARTYPAGERLFSDDANFDATYGRVPDAYGPDVAGSHPGSTSPFDVLDMTGNALEMTVPRTPELGQIVFRGGGWYYGRQGATTATRMPGEPTTRDQSVGARICAPSPTE